MSEAYGKVAYRAVLLAGALVVFGLLFRQLLTLLLAILITVIIAIAVSALTDRLERRLDIPRPIGALLTLLAAVAVIAGLLVLLVPPFVDQTNEFADDVPGIVDDLRDRLHDITGAEPGEISEEVDNFVDRYRDDPSKVIAPIASIGLSVVGGLGALILMLITAYYIAIRPWPLIDGMQRLVPPAHRDRALHVMQRLRSA